MMSCLMGSRTRMVLTSSSRAGRASFHSCGGMTLMIPDFMPYLSTFSIWERKRTLANRRPGPAYGGGRRGSGATARGQGKEETHEFLEVLELVHGGSEDGYGARVVVGLDITN